MNANKEAIRTYLCDLRDSGEINMMSAGPYLMRDLGMSRVDAREALLDWMLNPEPQGEMK